MLSMANDLTISWLLLLFICELVRNSAGVSIQGRKAKTKTRLVLRVNRFMTCPGTEEWNYINITMSNSPLLPNGLYSADLDAVVKVGFPKVINAEGKFEKCTEAVSSNTCEYFRSVKFENVDICTVMKMPGSFWRKWFDTVQPPLDCPPKAGFYSNRNASIDVDWLDAMGLPLDRNIWFVTAKLSDKNKRPIMCARSETTFFRVRN